MQPAGGVDWGNVPTWIGSVLSATSVLVALGIIIRDRRRAVLDQPSKVNVSIENEDSDQWYVHFNVYNGSDSVVVQPVATARPTKEGEANGAKVRRAVFNVYEEDLTPGAPELHSHLFPRRFGRLTLSIAKSWTDYEYSLDFGMRGERWRLYLPSYTLIRVPEKRWAKLLKGFAR